MTRAFPALHGGIPAQRTARVRAAGPEHIQENGQIFDFAPTEQEMQAIGKRNQYTPFYTVTPESLQRLATAKCKFEL